MATVTFNKENMQLLNLCREPCGGFYTVLMFQCKKQAISNS